MLLVEEEFLLYHKESILGDPHIGDCGMVRFICGARCKTRGVPLGF